jgi:hygromycin-B 4-O-kinase
MGDLRPVVTREQVLALLSKHFSTSVTGLSEVDGGSVARTFAFQTDGQKYVIRFNLDRMLTSNFPKELYVWRKLAATEIPMAPMIEVGRMDDLHFAISHRMPGKTLMQHNPDEIRQLMPQIIQLIDAIHYVDVSDTKGYGVFDYQGQGMARSWHGFLRAVADEELEQDYFGKWYHLFEDTFLERDIFERVYQYMLSLLDACPEERYLVQGSISFNNLLAQDGKLTAILDWIDARYGDFVYDIATLDYWSSYWSSGFFSMKELFRQYYQQRSITIPDYEQRILCYQCYITLSAMRFYAQSGDEKSYRVVRTRVMQELGK